MPLSNEEALNLLNMDDFQDEDDYDNDHTNNKDNSISICGLSFEKLKAKMTDITGDGKVNNTFCCC